MNTCEPIPLAKPSRQARLRIWLMEHGLQSKDLAHQLGVSPQTMSNIASGLRNPPHHIKRLIDLGVPADLLPEPGSGRPGPVPKAK